MNGKNFKRNTRFGLVFITSFCLCFFVTFLYISTKTKMEQAQMEQLVLLKGNKIQIVISRLLYKTQMLAALVIQQNGLIRDFEKTAATIIDDPAIKNVILAPDGVVRYVYPYEGNEAVEGFDFFSNLEGNTEATSAKDDGELVLGGPFNLIQGGQALVGRLPVYLTCDKGRRFWGLVSVTLDYPQALAGAELEQLQQQNLAYEIWRISPDTGSRQVIAASNYSYNENSPYVEQPLSILNAQWFFRLSPVRIWYQHPETWIFLTVGTILSALAASLALNNQDLRRIKIELEYLTYNDPLTCILNRRGLYESLSNILKYPDSQFVLSYIDLDKFKKVNDTFGHPTGNYFLEWFVSVIKEKMDQNNIFARIGGDEFVLIFKDTVDTAKVKAFWEQLRQYFNQNAVPGQKSNLFISFSEGTVAYPTDSEVLSDLIARADAAMYIDKKIKK